MRYVNYPIHLNRKLTPGTNDAFLRVQMLLAHVSVGVHSTFPQKITATAWTDYLTNYQNCQVRKNMKVVHHCNYMPVLSLQYLFPFERLSTCDTAQEDTKLQGVQFNPVMMACTVGFFPFTNLGDI